MRLYQHQQKAFRAVFAALKRKIKRQLVVMPTGAGKTVTFAHIIKRRGTRTLVLAHRDELLDQAAKTIRQVMPRASVGLVRSGVDESDRKIVVASVQSLARPGRLKRMGKDFNTIIVDEAHHALADSYQRIIQHFAKAKPLVLGVTATPFRAGNKGLDEMFDETVFEADIAEGVRQGWLSDIEGKLIYLKDADFSKVSVRNGDYDLAELEAIMRAANWHEYVANAYLKYARKRKTIIFVPRVSMAYELAEHIRSLGGKAEAIDGKMATEKRRDILSRLAKGKLDAIVNCAVLTEGFDDPSLSCVVMARPTRSRGLYFQCIGRGLRWQEDKTCLVLDMVGATQRHDLVTLPKLAGVEQMNAEERFSAALNRGQLEAKERVLLEAEMQARKIELLRDRQNPSCPHCGSPRTVKRLNKPSKTRAYQCNECRRRFTPKPNWVNTNPTCPHCQSSNTKKHGLKPRGNWNQGYRCNDCRRKFTPRSETALPPCAHCQATDVMKFGRPEGKQRYKCRRCKKSFTE